MSRHSKNNTAAPTFTYHEKKMLKNQYGTIQQRLGMDSQIQFSQCHLCLQQLVDPLVCRKGHLFCKICIVQNLYDQKNEQQKQKKENEGIQKFQNQKEQNDQLKKIQEEQMKFEQVEYYHQSSLNSTLEQDQFYLINQGNKKMSEKEYNNLVQKKEIIENRKQFNNQTIKEKVQTNFWIPENNDQYGNNELKIKEILETICPSSQDHIIKFKQLIPAKIDFQEDNTVTCYSCKKELKFQKVSMIKKCGHVYCKSCIYNICLKHKQCFVCHQSIIDKNDIQDLQESQSCYSYHNNVLGVVLTPAFQG